MAKALHARLPVGRVICQVPARRIWWKSADAITLELLSQIPCLDDMPSCCSELRWGDNKYFGCLHLK